MFRALLLQVTGSSHYRVIAARNCVETDSTRIVSVVPGTSLQIIGFPKIPNAKCASVEENLSMSDEHSRRAFLLATASTATLPVLARANIADTPPSAVSARNRGLVDLALNINERDHILAL